jgi:acyl carrier protein
MTKEEVLNKLVAVIQQHFRQPSLAITEESTAATVRGWDSLAHVGLMLRIERAFGIRFENHEIASFDSVGQLSALVATKVSNGN